MKPANLNFVSGHRKQLVMLSALLCLVGLMLGVAGIYAVMHTDAYKSRVSPVELRIQELKGQQRKYREALLESPTPNDIEALSKRIEILAKRLKLKGVRVSEIFRALEATIPDKAYVLQLYYPYEDEAARMMLRVENEAVMSETLKRLEENERLTNIVLAGQSREEEGREVVVADIRFSLSRVDK